MILTPSPFFPLRHNGPNWRPRCNVSLHSRSSRGPGSEQCPQDRFGVSDEESARAGVCASAISLDCRLSS